MIVWHSEPAAPLAPLPRPVLVAGWLTYAAVLVAGLAGWL